MLRRRGVESPLDVGREPFTPERLEDRIERRSGHLFFGAHQSRVDYRVEQLSVGVCPFEGHEVQQLMGCLSA